MTQKRTLMLCAGVVLLTTIAACGGGGGGGSTGSTGSTSTVSGNISNLSTAMQLRGERPTMLARLLDVFSPVSEAFAGHSGIGVHVAGLHTLTDPNGFFSITGPFSGPLTITFDNGSKTFTLTVNVPPGVDVILHDIALHADGTAAPTSFNFFALFGTLGSSSCNTTPETLTVTLGSQSIVVDLDGSTHIEISGQSGPAACSDLAAQTGKPVRVVGEQQSDGSLLARRVKVNPQGGHHGEDHEVEFHGSVTAVACPDSITVLRSDGQSVTVHLTSSTHFEDGVTCADLDGQNVEVEGTLAADGVDATEIEMEGGGGPTPTPTSTPSPTPTPTPTV